MWCWARLSSSLTPPILRLPSLFTGLGMQPKLLMVVAVAVTGGETCTQALHWTLTATIDGLDFVLEPYVRRGILGTSLKIKSCVVTLDFLKPTCD